MIKLDDLRKMEVKIIMLGSHPGIIQSILDYDYLTGKTSPSVTAIIANGRKQERYFWGESEVTIPVASSVELLTSKQRNDCTVLINVQSARRVLASTITALDLCKHVKVITIFAEQTPELHSLELAKISVDNNILIAGPSSVGILLPGHAKLGAIGGTQHPQLSAASILDMGDTAVISTSGGIVNELIHTVTGAGLGVSFAIALGGDRFPVTSPAEAMLLAEHDKATKRIVFFGELGGQDEYEIAKLRKAKKLTKETIAYIAGTVAELFDEPPQFGHAKALARSNDESARVKKQALRKAGVQVCDEFANIAKVLHQKSDGNRQPLQNSIGVRKKSIIVSRLSGDVKSEVQLLGSDLLATVDSNSIASLTLSVLLGEKVRSPKAISLVDYIIKLLIDHGPYVSGAVNTIVAARAGKDLASSLASGLLTIGPRFGGAINDASANWLACVQDNIDPRTFVESLAKRGIPISGIGHKKYRIDLPDPRVQALLKLNVEDRTGRYLRFALEVEKVTTSKKANLILNVDGAIAAVMLDLLETELGYDEQKLRELVDIEFFNALFILSRSIGFAGHYLDQRRNDEGLLRLSSDDIRYIGG